MPWQQHYLTLCGQKDAMDAELTDAELFEKDAMLERPKDEDEIEFRNALHSGIETENEPEVKKLPRRGNLSKKDIQLILYSQNIFDEYAEQEEGKRQAKAIKRVNPSRYMLEKQSASAYIVRALYKSNAPLHRDALLVEMERLGWKSKASLFNKTKYVERLCSKNEFMLLRVKPATYTLRQGFIGAPLTKPMPTEHAILEPTRQSTHPKDRGHISSTPLGQAVP
jgi:hypothetical protein